EIGWRRRPALYREHALFVTVSPSQAREQRACGARVIMINGEQAALREQIAAAQAQAPLTEAEMVPELREIFAGHATPVRLAGLASLAGLPDHLVTGRHIAVLARVEDAADAAALAARLRRQRSVPAEVVVAVATRAGESAELSRHAVIAALADLAGQGILITAVPEEAGDARWIALAAKAARSPWVAPWQADREYDEWYLLDLACARECAQADAVGYAGSGGSGYAYVTSLDPALARREFFGPDGSDHGLRLISLIQGVVA
ncbi:MAG TPA: hypothetical protein VJ254_09580, partial [Streptosporangiaceae bacterium]|nr:hypothetical protein [Streptosporangiaceae bacterium]